MGDGQRPATIYVGVVNDKMWGGVFQSDNGGLSWVQKSAGLDGHDVFSLGQASDGTLVAGRRHGVCRMKGDVWSKAYELTLFPTTITKPAPRRESVGQAGKARRCARGTQR